MILVIIFFSKEILVKPVTWIEKTKKKGFIIYSSSAKAVFFPYKRTAFFSGTPNLFGPSYFEAALGVGGKQKSELRLKDLLKLEIEGLQLQIQALNKGDIR